MSIYWTETTTGSANTETTVTHSGETGRKHYLAHLTVSFSGATSGNDIEVRVLDGDDNELWDAFVDADRGLVMQESFSIPIDAPPGKAIKVTVDAAGASAVTSISIGGYTQ